MKLNML